MTKNEEVLAILIKEHERLIFKVANRFFNVEKEDLIQAGKVGIMKAFYNFNGESLAKFSTYAYDYIFGEMYNLSLGNNDLKITKETLRLYKMIEGARAKLAQISDKMPSNQELSRFLEIDELTIYFIENAVHNILRLEESGSSGADNNLYEIIPAKEEIDQNTRILIDDSIKVLPQDEQKIIHYRYFKDYTQAETAKELNMTQASVSRYEKKALNQMRSFIAS